MLSGGFKLLTKDDHLLIKEDVTFLPSCKAVSSSAIALPYTEEILEERDGKGKEVEDEEWRDGIKMREDERRGEKRRGEVAWRSHKKKRKDGCDGGKEKGGG